MLNEIKTFIESHDDFLIAGHINADGDAIASSLLVSHLLKSLGKKYELIFHDELLDQRFLFLEGFDQIRCAQKEKLKYDAKAAIICDTPSVERTGEAAGFFPDKTHVLKIDHHPSEEDFGIINYVDTESSSTTCLVYQIMEKFNFQFNKSIAQIVLTGLMYDTGRFSYSNTKAVDFEIAAKMIHAGADVQLSYLKIFCENSLSATKTIGEGLSGMETYFYNQLGIISLTHEETIKNSSGEIEELASHTTAVTGIHVGLFIREPEKGLFKISLRSRGRVNVNEVAAEFGGGGHKKAAGCRIKANSYEEARDLIVAVVEKHLKQHSYL